MVLVPTVLTNYTLSFPNPMKNALYCYFIRKILYKFLHYRVILFSPI